MAQVDHQTIFFAEGALWWQHRGGRLLRDEGLTSRRAAFAAAAAAFSASLAALQQKRAREGPCGQCGLRDKHQVAVSMCNMYSMA